MGRFCCGDGTGASAARRVERGGGSWHLRRTGSSGDPDGSVGWLAVRRAAWVVRGGVNDCASAIVTSVARRGTHRARRLGASSLPAYMLFGQVTRQVTRCDRDLGCAWWDASSSAAGCVFLAGVHALRAGQSPCFGQVTPLSSLPAYMPFGQVTCTCPSGRSIALLRAGHSAVFLAGVHALRAGHLGAGHLGHSTCPSGRSPQAGHLTARR
jgi:hypothetical protein